MSKLFIYLLAGFTLSPTVQALERYALLVGINHYQNERDLEGPVNDVQALHKSLINRGFKDKNISVLTEKEANLSNIRQALQQLVDNSSAGDHVFIFYSGHGAANRSINTKNTGTWEQNLPKCTGAWVLPDHNPKQPGSIKKNIMLASRDLRPIVQQLDQGGRQVFMAFDTCFAGNTYRSGAHQNTTGNIQGQPRLFNNGLIDDNESMAGETCDTSPYQHVFYIGASTLNGQAQDINQNLLSTGRQTVDGKPHGAMTDALLALLDGHYNADKNANSLQYSELVSGIEYIFKQKNLAQKITYQPLLNEDAQQLHNRFVFENPLKAATTTPPLYAGKSAPVRIKFERISPELKEKVINLGDFKLVDHDSDLLLMASGSLYQLYDGGGYLLKKIAQNQEPILIKALQQQRVLQHIAYQPGKAKVNLRVELVSAAGSILHEDDSAQFIATADSPVHWVIFTLDPAGGIQLAYPDFANHRICKAAEKQCTLPEITIFGPEFGTEYVLAFGLLNAYPDIDKLKNTSSTFNGNNDSLRMMSWEEPVIQDFLQYLQKHPEQYQHHLLEVTTEAKQPL